MLLAVCCLVTVHLESLESAQQAGVALDYDLKNLLCFFPAFQTSHV